ncbi:MAG: hypothetical protein QGG02_00330 [Gammaproteobacteria bacterium]|nr:hypothetical protein [Gammaproteobacteria bacterium]MDP6733098.1 hypothetical protein [Gammaproteobacteria bacterium]
MNNRLKQALQLICCGLLLGIQGNAQAQLSIENNTNFFLDSPDSTKYAVIMTGPSVGEQNQSQFRQWAFSLHDILARDYGYSSDRITLLLDRGEQDSPGGERIDGACDRNGIEQGLAALKARIETGDQITLYLIGHGSGAEEEAKFNIVGPDITGIEFAGMLDQFDEQDIAIINTTSASYGFSASLSGEGRVVISSTRSPSERYDPVFSRYFIEALDSRNGDRDKNNRVSMLEAFQYAKSNVQAWYEEQGRLASEHAGLDDNGDALFALEPTLDAADGRLAEIAYIDTLMVSNEGLSPAALSLKAKMQEVERSVFILRGRKADFLEADYWQQMEVLLVELARTTGQFNEQTTQ